ncbi:hypothetical protein BDZ89DRAFT_1146993 [Hymenopellis radicata]|nr:hypothetical protein BDZ89DRAFT_1146993 [Hymenopellis radicata]
MPVYRSSSSIAANWVAHQNPAQQMSIPIVPLQPNHREILHSFREVIPNTPRGNAIYEIVNKALRPLSPNDVLSGPTGFYIHAHPSALCWGAASLLTDIPLTATNNVGLASRIEGNLNERRIPTSIPPEAMRELGFTVHFGYDIQSVKHTLGIDTHPIPNLGSLIAHYNQFQRFLRINIELLIGYIEKSLEIGMEAFINWGAPFNMTWVEYLCHIDMPTILAAASERKLSCQLSSPPTYRMSRIVTTQCEHGSIDSPPSYQSDTDYDDEESSEYSRMKISSDFDYLHWGGYVEDIASPEITSEFPISENA